MSEEEERFNAVFAFDGLTCYLPTEDHLNRIKAGLTSDVKEIERQLMSPRLQGHERDSAIYQRAFHLRQIEAVSDFQSVSEKIRIIAD